MKSWKDYPDAEPWMLVNVTEALRARRLDQEAHEVCLHARSLSPGHGQHLHALWLACDAIVAGDTQHAAELLDESLGTELDDDYSFLATVARAAIDIASVASSRRVSQFDRIRRTIDQAVRDYDHLQAEPARRRFYHVVLRLLARSTGTLSARVWAIRRRLLG